MNQQKIYKGFQENSHKHFNDLYEFDIGNSFLRYIFKFISLQNRFFKINLNGNKVITMVLSLVHVDAIRVA